MWFCPRGVVDVVWPICGMGPLPLLHVMNTYAHENTNQQFEQSVLSPDVRTQFLRTFFVILFGQEDKSWFAVRKYCDR